MRTELKSVLTDQNQNWWFIPVSARYSEVHQLSTCIMLISNYSYPDSAHFPYLDLLVISLCKSFSSFLIHVHICKPKLFHYSYLLLCFYEIYDLHSYAIHILTWCSGSGYVHPDMHILVGL